MKIIKTYSIETWFSPGRYMEEMTMRSKSYYEIGDKRWFIIPKGETNTNNRQIHRKHGPSRDMHYIEWTNCYGTHRNDGPAEIHKESNKKYWWFNDFTDSEEWYWNQ